MDGEMVLGNVLRDVLTGRFEDDDPPTAPWDRSR